jgi:major histocompatibility complex class I
MIPPMASTTPGFDIVIFNKNLKTIIVPGVVAHAFNPSTQEVEAGGFLSLRPAWSTK